MKQYSSFKEIDQDLRYLRLKSQIDLEEFKMSISDTKESLKHSLSPITYVTGFIGSLAKKAMAVKLAAMFFTKKKD